jgi:RNA polymerase sigma factor (sigma-70 family)
MSDVRLEIRFKNARLWNAIAARSGHLKDTAQSRGLWEVNGPIRAWCMSVGVQVQAVYDLLCLRVKPYRSDRWTGKFSWRPIASRLAQLLDTTEAELFPLAMYESTVNKIVTDVQLDRFVALSAARHTAIPATVEADIIADELRTTMAAALTTLPSRSAKILALRFGMDGGKEHTLAEVGRIIGVSPERVREIEAKALRKLRQPNRCKALEPFMYGKSG